MDRKSVATLSILFVLSLTGVSGEACNPSMGACSMQSEDQALLQIPAWEWPWAEVKEQEALVASSEAGAAAKGEEDPKDKKGKEFLKESKEERKAKEAAELKAAKVEAEAEEEMAYEKDAKKQPDSYYYDGDDDYNPDKEDEQVEGEELVSEDAEDEEPKGEDNYYYEDEEDDPETLELLRENKGVDEDTDSFFRAEDDDFEDTPFDGSRKEGEAKDKEILAQKKKHQQDKKKDQESKEGEESKDSEESKKGEESEKSEESEESEKDEESEDTQILAKKNKKGEDKKSPKKSHKKATQLLQKKPTKKDKKKAGHSAVGEEAGLSAVGEELKKVLEAPAKTEEGDKGEDSRKYYYYDIEEDGEDAGEIVKQFDASPTGKGHTRPVISKKALAVKKKRVAAEIIAKKAAAEKAEKDEFQEKLGEAHQEEEEAKAKYEELKHGSKRKSSKTAASESEDEEFDEESEDKDEKSKDESESEEEESEDKDEKDEESESKESEDKESEPKKSKDEGVSLASTISHFFPWSFSGGDASAHGEGERLERRHQAAVLDKVAEDTLVHLR